MSTLASYDAALVMRGYDAIPQPIRYEAIQEARRRVFLQRRWSWLEATSTTISTVADTPTISLSTITDLAHLDAVRLSDGTCRIKIDWKPYSEIRDLQDRFGSTPSDVPRFWTRRSNTVVFFPTPRKVYTATIDYVKAAADLTGATVDVIPDKNRDLVTWAAVVPLAFRQRQLGESSAADQYFLKTLVPQHGGQDAVEQRQSSEQIRQGHWSY